MDTDTVGVINEVNGGGAGSSPSSAQFGSAFVADPYPVYQRLQAEGPLWLDGGGPASGTWLFTRYTDVEQILRDSRLTKDPRVHLPSSPVPTQEQAAPHMLLLDPPDHTRLRGLCRAPSHQGWWGSSDST